MGSCLPPVSAQDDPALLAWSREAMSPVGSGNILSITPAVACSLDRLAVGDLIGVGNKPVAASAGLGNDCDASD